MFIWHSKGTEESATALAQKLECEHGTVPPTDYEGDVICFNAKPSPKFKWDSRKFGKIINDPRKLQQGAWQTKVGGLAIKVRTICMKRPDGYTFNTIKSSVKEGESTEIRLSDAALVVLQGICTNLDTPDFVALDGVYNQNSETYLLEKPVFGPALADDTMLTEVVAEFLGGLIQTDKQKLIKLANEGTPEELKVLMGLLSRVKKTT